MANKIIDMMQFTGYVSAIEAYKQIHPPLTFHEFLNINIKWLNHYEYKFLSLKQVTALKTKFNDYKPLSYFDKYLQTEEELLSLIKKKHMKFIYEGDKILIHKKTLEYYFDTLYSR